MLHVGTEDVRLTLCKSQFQHGLLNICVCLQQWPSNLLCLFKYYKLQQETERDLLLKKSHSSGGRQLQCPTAAILDTFRIWGRGQEKFKTLIYLLVVTTLKGLYS